MNAAMRCDSLSVAAVSRPTRRIRSIMFDTSVNDLGKKNIVLRGYELHGASFVELSWNRPVASGGARGSVELRVPTLDVGKMLGSSENLRQSIADRPLEARCVAETERRERLIELADARIVVAFDDGFVEFCGRRAPFHEIELRLLDGAEPRLWRFAAELSRRLPIRCLPMSETEHALASIAGREIATVKAQRATLPADASLDEAIVAIIGSCLDQFVANWPALIHSHDPEESIHQMRVALRRLRAGVGLLRHGVSSPALEAAAASAKRIAAELGKARNFDILEDMLATGPLADISHEPSFYALLDAVECRRASAHAAVQSLVAATETTQFVLDLRATLAAREWKGVALDAEEAHAEGPAHASVGLETAAAGSARDYAVFSLDRLHRKSMKKSRDLASLTPEQRHEARIALKKSRYAAEFFETLFDARSEARKYLRRSAAVQDALGAFNDMAVAAQLLREIGEERKDNVSPASSFAIGLCAHAQNGASTDWKKTEKSLKKLRPFWR